MSEINCSVFFIKVVNHDYFINNALLIVLMCAVLRISEEEYVKAIKEEISKVVKLQEELDIDVLVHGEPEVRFPLRISIQESEERDILLLNFF